SMTVRQLAFAKAVLKSGWSVPRAAVNRAMMPYFTDETGAYSARVYKQADARQVEELRSRFEEDFQSRRYADDIYGAAETLGGGRLYGLKISEKETDFLRAQNEEGRAFQAAVFSTSDYPDSEKKAYGAENAQKFIQYDLSVITCADKAKAEALAKRLADEELTFDDAVAEYSRKTYSNDSGKMSSRYGYQLSRIIPDDADFAAVTSLETDALSAPVQTSVGYSIFRADSSPVLPDFDSAADISTVSNYLTAYEYSIIEEYFVEKAERFAEEAAAGFKTAASRAGAAVVDIPAFPLNYGNVSVLESLNTSIEGLSGASTNEHFLSTAFALEEGEVSKPIVNGRNILVLKFTGTEANDEPAPADAVAAELSDYDVYASEKALFESPKLKNNFNDVYYSYFYAGN
ncbi:MAG: peptidyl-prolyl cis-trans isomerase, partial [Treponemataceae bacterium]|nr:peptidyl-prolyl cis-trans isomerase [Treponemataceae bacterium]